jgi:hypothetical protein
MKDSKLERARRGDEAWGSGSLPDLKGIGCKSVRTLQGWEQGRKQPSGAARTLLAIANKNPKALLEVMSKWPATDASAGGAVIQNNG